jgi:hypothetical protein
MGAASGDQPKENGQLGGLQQANRGVTDRPYEEKGSMADVGRPSLTSGGD